MHGLLGAAFAFGALSDLTLVFLFFEVGASQFVSIGSVKSSGKYSPSLPPPS